MELKNIDVQEICPLAAKCAVKGGQSNFVSCGTSVRLTCNSDLPHMHNHICFVAMVGSTAFGITFSEEHFRNNAKKCPFRP